MKNWMMACLFCFHSLYADSWSPGAQIPEGTSMGVLYDATLIYDASNTSVLATWADTAAQQPYFSVYNGTVWSTASEITLTTSTGVVQNIGLVYDPTTMTVIAAWSNVADSLPYYAVYNGSWSTDSTIPLGLSGSTGASTNVLMAYDVMNSSVFAAWTDNTTRQPYYSIYSGGTWSTPATIALGGSSGVKADVSLTYDAGNSTMIAAWSDMTTSQAYYSVYNGTSWTTSTITMAPSDGVLTNIVLVYNPSNSTMVAAWGDSMSPYVPYYSVYNGTSWTTPASIPLPSPDAGVYQNINLAFDTSSNTVFAAWQDNELAPIPPSSSLPYYSTFDGSTWTSGAIPPGTSAGVDYDVYIAYDASTQQMIAAWGNYPGTPYPFYSIYSSGVTPPPPPPPPSPPPPSPPPSPSPLSSSISATPSSIPTFSSEPYFSSRCTRWTSSEKQF